MSSISSNSGWKSARGNLRKRFNNILHKYPKLPENLSSEDNFPFQIGSNISVRDYNDFLDQNEKIGYKFCWDRGNVYIIEMANTEHEAVVSYLFKRFDKPNNGVTRGPIDVLGQPYHYSPTGYGNKIAPDLAVRPRIAYLQPSSHPGPPPTDKRCQFPNINDIFTQGNPHARIVCEVGNTQSIDNWNNKCEEWMHENYVRCVLGIKLFPKKPIGIFVHQAMVARLWMRQASVGSVVSANVALAAAGVHVTEWDFGTIQYNNIIPTPTGCNALNLNAFQINIPIADAFYDPPIVGGNITPYAIFVPGTVVGVNFVIDLFELQQVVLEVQ